MKTKKEVAKIFNVTETTVTNWMREGYIKFIKIGHPIKGTVRFEDSEIERIRKGE